MINRWVYIAGLIALTLACGKVQEEAPEDYSDFVDKEVVRDIKIRYSDSAALKTIITGPEMLRYSNAKKEVFPKGIHAVFYSDDGRPNSRLIARKAYRFPSKNQVMVEDHVILFNEQGDSLVTSQLTWDEKKGKIYTNRFVRLTKKDRVILGYGFESNQDFSKGRVKAIEGTWKLE